MDFYYSPSLPDEAYYYNQVPYDSGYHESYYYPPVQSSVSNYSYEFYPAQPLVAYSAWPESCTDSVSTEYVVHHSVVEVDEDLNFLEYDLLPFGGGYDIVQTYGKPLPPGEEICYPRSSPLNPGSVSAVKTPHPEKAEDLKAETQPTVEEQGEEVITEDEEGDVTEDEEEVDTEEEDDEGEGQSSDGEPYEKSVGSVQVYGGVDPPAFNQVPPGYGLEAYDLCENLFGYWPCLSRVNNKKKCPSCGRDICVKAEEDGDKWKRTADYLFGSPDPYRGWADQNGYAYQMRYQQPPSTLYYQADQYGHISWSG